MSSANVLPFAAAQPQPSAPPGQSLYPNLPAADSPQPQAENVRLQKINEIANSLGQEDNHYRLVAKKYKRAKKKKNVNWSAAGSSVLSAAFSSASFGSARSVVAVAKRDTISRLLSKALNTTIIS